MQERRYATIGDYSNFTGQRAPENFDRRILVRASRRVDRRLLGAWYDTDEHGMPTDPEVAAALRDATCAVAQAWIDSGDLTGTGASQEWDQVQIGDVRLGRSGRSNASDDPTGPLTAAAEDQLWDAGLLPIDPFARG